MILPCTYLCQNKNENGYCLTTSCINTKYNTLYMPSSHKPYKDKVSVIQVGQVVHTEQERENTK